MRSHRSRGFALLVMLVVAALQLLVGAGAAHADAEWCVEKGPTYVLGKPVLPSGEYCVPGP